MQFNKFKKIKKQEILNQVKKKGKRKKTKRKLKLKQIIKKKNEK